MFVKHLHCLVGKTRKVKFRSETCLQCCEKISFVQGYHSHWKTWKNERSFSSQGKVREFLIFTKKSGNFI